MTSYKNWIINQDNDDIIWLGFDRAGDRVNTISEDVLDELNSILMEIEQDKVKGLVIYSAKEKGFIAGADVRVFTQFSDISKAGAFLKKGQAVFSRLEALKIPTVAMINGFCMGGGYELALACRYRIATDELDTKIGLPEVLLGIHPGWGGTARLVRLIGGFKALSQVMLTGSAISSSRAKQLGMVDDVVPYRQLKRAARWYILNKPKTHEAGLMAKADGLSFVRKGLAALMRHSVAKKVRQEHYPAPFAMIDLWERDGGFGDRAYTHEAESVEQLISKNDTALNLIRVFGLRERLKSFAKGAKTPFTHVHVIGAGVMGGDIAAWCALKGMTVTLQDQSYEKIAPAIGRAYSLYQKKLKKPRPVQAAMDRLIPDPEGHGIARADVIIEAVFENLEVKQSIFTDVEKKASKEAILATNTSSIPLDEISTVMKNPERLVGIHFFNPVARMDLVEVVKSAKTKDTIVDKACSFVGAIGKLPLPVASSPGFLVNRVLMPYLMECMHLLQEGYSGATIDEAAKSFGMFMGPVELADTVGLDVCLAVAQNLTQHYGGDVPEKLRDMVKNNKLGRKTGEGFYKYKQGKPVKGKADLTRADVIANRLIMRMVNESMACLREGVVEDADLLDAGMIFGTGFAPFRGGPMNYAKKLGKEHVVDMFKKLNDSYGQRFSPDSFVADALT